MVNMVIKRKLHKWTAGFLAVAFAWMAVGFVSPDLLSAGTANPENSSASMEATGNVCTESNSFEKEGQTQEIAKRKKFPWLWVAAGVVVAGVIVYFTLIKKPKYDLTVEVGTGVAGTPAAGEYTYKKGKQIVYNFVCDDGYKNLTVSLDGKTTAASGTIVMNQAHSLQATAIQMADYSLVVKTNEGVTGSPAAGTYQYREGTSVPYHYEVAADYKNLSVLLDGKKVAVSGTIVMDQVHNLEASAAKIDEFTLIVITDAGISGTPVAGKYFFKKGTEVSYQYTATNGIPFAKLDGEPLLPSGSLRMNSDHILKISPGLLPDIRGKWRIQMKYNYLAKKEPDLDVSFSGAKENGTIWVLDDYVNSHWRGWYLSNPGAYTISSAGLIEMVFLISDSDIEYTFVGNFIANNDISGNFYYASMDEPIPNGRGTWTATRIE